MSIPDEVKIALVNDMTRCESYTTLVAHDLMEMYKSVKEENDPSESGLLQALVVVLSAYLDHRSFNQFLEENVV